MKKLLVIGIIIILVGMSIPSTGINVEKSSASYDGNTLYVGGSGPGNYTSIHQAVNNSQNGDTIFVYNGTYYDNVKISKSINVIGEDKDNTHVLSKQQNPSSTVFELSYSNIQIKGFTAMKGLAGIHILGDIEGINKNILISDCNLINNYIDYGGLAIRVGYTNNITIENCYFQNEGVGIRIGGYKHTNITISNCFFDSDTLTIQDVKYMFFNDCVFYDSRITAWEWSDNLEFYNCTMDKEDDSYVQIYGSHQIFENCVFSNCSYAAINLDYSEDALIRNCVFKDGKNESQGISLDGPNALIEGCIIKDMNLGIYYWRGENLTVRNCHFENNQIAFYNFNELCTHNRFLNNNFINNQKDFYNSAWIFINIYNHNYWDKWLGWGPYRVLKTISLMGWLNWDFFPSKEPYDI